MTETLEVQITCPPERVDILSELLWTVPALDAVMEQYRDEVVESVKAFTRAPQALENIQALLASNPDLAACRIDHHRLIREADWAESWKQFWHVSPITERLTIRPTWEAYTPTRPDEVVIDLDPGCAFGTGTHDTTRLMLQGMEALAATHDLSQCSVLDIGTGSGILAIYAAKLGCRSVLAIDNDPVATAAARENVTLNHVADRVTLSDTPLAELCQTRYDIILANIIAPVILELLPAMRERLAPGGVLLLSGLIASSVTSVAEALTGFSNIETRQQGDWFSLQGTYHG